ncbi:MAG: redoxin domain-containing protein [Dehalococcoidia bacterium]
MRIRRAMQITVGVVVIVVAVMVLSWYAPGCAKSPAAEITFTIALDTDNKVGPAYNIRFVPATLLIDENGIIRGIWPGAFRSKEHVLEWLDEVTASEATSALPGVAPETGHMAPDFTLATVGGQPVTLSDLRDQWVLLNFWTLGCRYCVMQMPYLQAAFEEKAGGIEFIGINLGESEEKVREFLGR